MINPIQKPSPNFSSRDGNKVQFICVHIMDGTIAGTDYWFSEPSSQVSSQYGVGLNGEVHQYVSEDNMAWANGIVNQPTAQVIHDNVGKNPNKISISIENEGDDLAHAPESQLVILAELIHSLCMKYSLPIDRYHIVGHQEIDGVKKVNCPSPDRSIMDSLVKRVVAINSVVVPQNNNSKVVDLLNQALSLLK